MTANIFYKVVRSWPSAAGPGGGIVDRPGDLGPVQPPASVCGQAVEEEALDVPVALPEWVEVVDLVIMMG